MTLPALLGLPDWGVDAALAAAWTLILAATLYRDYYGLRDRHNTYLWTAVSLFWLGYSLFSLANYPAGPLATALQAVGVAALVAALAASYGWFRTRGGEN